MNDHKDITNYAAVPTLVLPPGSCRPLTPAECYAYANYYEARAELWCDPRARASDLKESRGFRQRAAERVGIFRSVSRAELDHIREHGTLLA